jgi:integrase
MKRMPGPKPKPFPAGQLGAVAQQFLIDAVTEGQIRQTSVKDYRSTLMQLCSKYAGRPLTDFDGPAGTRLLIDYMATVTPGSKKARRAHLRSFFDYVNYFHGDEVPRNPALRLRIPRSQTLVRTPQPLAQIETLIAAQPSPRDRLAILLGYPLALRRGAVRGVRLKDFKDDHVSIILKGGNSTPSTSAPKPIRTSTFSSPRAGCLTPSRAER